VRSRVQALLAALPVAFLALAAPAAAQEGLPNGVEATAELTPRVVGVGEPVKLTLTVEGPGLLTPRLRPRFDPGDLEIVAGPDSSHGLRLPGGGGWRYTWTWWLAARKPGAAAVTDLYILVDERRIDLPSFRIEVVSQPVGGAEPPRTRLEAMEELLDRTRDRLTGNEPVPAFLRAVASPARPYVGQRVVYTVYLYTRIRVRSTKAEEMPTFQGLWARPIDLAGQRTEVVEWEGDSYERTPVLRKELYALEADHHTIDPLTAQLVVEVTEWTRPFSFPVRRAKALRVESNPMTLDVRPLPPRPAGLAGWAGGGGSFAGTVGGMAVAADLRPAEVTVGESATLTVTVAGDGHMESLRAPRVDAGDWVEVLGPQSTPADEMALSLPAGLPGAAGAASGDEGPERERTWQYLLIPRRAGSIELPPLEIPYFDPEEERYRVARTGLPELRVRPAPAALATVDDSVAQAPTEIGRGSRRVAWLPGSGSWPGLLAWGLGVPAVAALVLLLVRRRQNPTGPPAAGAALCRERLDTALREDRPRRAAAAMVCAWREMLAETLEVPETVPPDRWADEALARGADRRACRELRTLVDDLHYLRFAPELSETRSLTAELIARSERLARDLHVGVYR
jgi:hypothetical protein